MAELNQLKGDLSGLHILVAGDIMIDRYEMGTAQRLSPEAPVPVVLWRETIDKPGGASNVAANLKSMGCRVSLMGLCGMDADGQRIHQLLADSGCEGIYLLQDSKRPTTVKTRIVANGHQITRMDIEKETPLSLDLQQSGLDQLSAIFTADRPDVLVLQDYNKGFFTTAWISQIMDMALKHGVRVAVDPKKDNFFSFQHAELFKPNLKEAQNQFPGNYTGIKDLEGLSAYLKERLNCKTLMITLASEGLWIDGENLKRIFPTKARRVADVSGAGDTVISLAAICMAKSFTQEFMAICCNEAGGQVCEKPGVVPVDKTLLINQLEDIIC